MIVIQNISHDPRAIGEHTYEVRINRMLIATFRHKREDGLGQCLLAAAKAVEKAKWDDLEALLRALP